jgi:hypothetical protein
MNKITIFAAVATAVALGAGAADADPTPRQLELANRYIADVQLDQTMSRVMQSTIPTMMAQMPSQMTDDQKAALQSVITDVTLEMTHKLVIDMAPAIADVFTEQELTDLVSFYESPTGRSLVAKTPLLAQRMQPIIVQLMPEMRREMLVKLCAKITCPASVKARIDQGNP